MYLTGRGVTQDHTEAARWLRKAANQGESQGQFNLGVAYHDDQGVPQGYAEAIGWFRKAADQGSGRSPNQPRCHVCQGQGVAQDLVEASKWFILAASASPVSEPEIKSKAAFYRDMAARMMTPEQIVEAQRLASEWKPK
jgi:uncharacterized protein